MYAVGVTKEDKKNADNVFLDNMLEIISRSRRPWILRKLRTVRAHTYYIMVKYFGNSSFFKEKT